MTNINCSSLLTQYEGIKEQIANHVIYQFAGISNPYNKTTLKSLEDERDFIYINIKKNCLS